jgi:hypothetical protein
MYLRSLTPRYERQTGRADAEYPIGCEDIQAKAVQKAIEGGT